MSIYINNKPAQNQVSPYYPEAYEKYIKEKVKQLQEKEVQLKNELMTYPSLMRKVGTDAQRRSLENPSENMAFFIIPDLTGTQWLMNDTLNLQAIENGWYNLISTWGNDTEVINIGIGSSLQSEDDIFYGYDLSIPEWKWWDQQYKNVTISGGEDATNPILVNWFQNNGTLLN